jgi:hypothetical protein
MFYENKYTKWYFSIIEKAKSEARKKLPINHPKRVYYEAHHVTPKCMGGVETVLLTAREHFIVHLLLTKMCDDYRMKTALVRMTRKSKKHEEYKNTSKWYEYIRKCLSISTSENSKKRWANKKYRKKMIERHTGHPGYTKGRKWEASPEAKNRLRGNQKTEAQKLRYINPKTLELWRLAAIGNPSTRGRKWFNNGMANVLSFTQPEGFGPGMIKNRKAA